VGFEENKIMKKKLLVSFSGGETSAFMAQWLWKHKQDEYDMIFVFANTGEENEETLRFVHLCEIYLGFPVVWIEALVTQEKRVGTKFKITNYIDASRDGEPFESVIKKYGIPNSSFPHCTRELKASPIHAYAKAIGWKGYYTAIGIRIDEIDRMNKHKEKLMFLYPLVSMIPMTKPKINFFWKLQTFRLELKGYQGNCKWCWKKSDAKLFTIAIENPKAFIFPGKMEARYSKYIPETRMKLMIERGEYPVYPITFFRKNRSVDQIIIESKNFNKSVIDDSLLYDLHNESCEVHSECSET
jgi:hypothetical protein